MPYKLAKQSGDTVNVPQIIISRLPDTEDDWVRVALYIVATGNCDEAEITRALHLKSEHKARQALLFWKGAGLIENSDDLQNTLNQPLGNVAYSESANNQSSAENSTGGAAKSSAKKSAHLTTPEVLGYAKQDEAIAFLTQECQRLMGGIVTQADLNIYVSMYIVDEMPVDFILLGTAHFAAQGKRSARYIERALLSWQREGIATYSDAEKYLKQLETQEEFVKRALKALALENTQPSKAERTLMCAWFERYKYDEALISEAAAIAGEKKNIKYVNGILRKWHEKGVLNIADVIREQGMNMQNISVSNPKAQSVLTGKMRPVPQFKTKPKGDAAT